MANIALSLGNTEIRQLDGLFSLNDLHRASGGEARHRPNYFLGNDQTKALIEEIEKAGNPAISAKPKVGTYVCRELVYAYAMWISAAFSLTVIRAFDAMYSPQAPYSVAPNQTLSAEQADELRGLITTHAETLPKDKQSAFVIQAWSKLKAHFGVGYRQIPAHLFSDAVSLIGRHIAETLTLEDAPTQYLLTCDAGRVSLTPITERDTLPDIARMADVIRDYRVPVSSGALAYIAQVCLERLRSKVGALEEARFIDSQRRQCMSG